MRSHLSVLGKVVLCALALGLTQCSKNKGKSQQVNISIEPNKPIVFTADITYINNAGSKVTVKAPWFMFNVKIENTSDTPVTIIAMHTEVTGVDESGQFVVNKLDWVPSSDDLIDDTRTCHYLDFGQFQKYGVAGNSGYLAISASTGSIGSCPSGKVLFYADSNPKQADTGGNPVIRYTVKMKPEGYFMDSSGVPSDRFENFTTIFTQ